MSISYKKTFLTLIVLFLMQSIFVGCSYKEMGDNSLAIESCFSRDESNAEILDNDLISNKNNNNLENENIIFKDIEVFEKYFKDIFSLDNVTISEKSIVYYGESNSWRIYDVHYDGQLHSTAFCYDTIGGYTFYKNIEYMPYSIALYAIKGDRVYTLKEAYENNLILIDEVYNFIPKELKK